MHDTWQPLDPAFDTRVRASFAAQPMMATLGIRIAELQPGRLVVDLPHDRRFTQQHGYLHAGALATAMDSACGYAAFSLMPADAEVLTTDLRLDLLRPASGEGFRITAVVRKAGRTLTVCAAEAAPAAGGAPVALMTACLMALRPG